MVLVYLEERTEFHPFTFGKPGPEYITFISFESSANCLVSHSLPVHSQAESWALVSATLQQEKRKKNPISHGGKLPEASKQAQNSVSFNLCVGSCESKVSQLSHWGSFNLCAIWKQCNLLQCFSVSVVSDPSWGHTSTVFLLHPVGYASRWTGMKHLPLVSEPPTPKWCTARHQHSHCAWGRDSHGLRVSFVMLLV